MSDMANLTAALASLKTEIGGIGVRMDANFKALQDALTASNPAAIQAATAEVLADVQALKDIGTRDTMIALTAEPPAPVVVPVP